MLYRNSRRLFTLESPFLMHRNNWDGLDTSSLLTKSVYGIIPYFHLLTLIMHLSLRLSTCEYVFHIITFIRTIAF